ncbi:unnamed protein product [Clonostachys rosea]|uniref:Uncharacterized protein n=1 Tax=Bionectria ochroleuca TaxID=29856 RepID=A0ABY6UT76_BIOOC|nr:unnamed protein product [Clonostachys rosea]
MSQEKTVKAANASSETQPPSKPQPSVSLKFTNDTLPNPTDWQHLVLSFRPNKLEKIMKSVGKSHSEETRFQTWAVVGEALSNSLLSAPAGVYMQMTTMLFGKDYFLFTRRGNKRGDGTGGILEVRIKQKLLARVSRLCEEKKSRSELLRNEDKPDNEEGEPDGSCSS